MNGVHRVKVYSKKLIYDFYVNRKITIIRGDSGTGKSTLVQYIQNANDKLKRGFTLECDLHCEAYNKTFKNWDIAFKEMTDAIIVLDEGFVYSECNKLLDVINNSDCYFILISRRLPKFLTYEDKYEMKRENNTNTIQKVIDNR